MSEAKEKNKKYGKIIAIILIALVVVTAAVIGVRFIINSNHETVDSRPVVRVAAPETRTVEVYTEQIGTVQPAESVNVLAMLAGEILEVNFNAGDKVKKGDVLLVINSDSLKSLEIQMNSAKIQNEDAQTALERTKVLFETGAVSQSALEQAQSGAEKAQLAYDAAKNQYDVQKKYSTITAPVSGTVEYKNAEVHSFASQGSPVAVISGEGKTSVAFGVSEDSMKTVKPGDQVYVYKQGYEGYGNITEINTMIGQNGLFNVKAELDDPDGLTTNARVIINILKNRAEDAMTIPLSAVYHDGGESFVYVLKDDNTIAKTVFTSGIDDGEYIVVEDGLTKADNVVYTWSRELYNGAEVTVNFDEQ